MLAAYSLLDCRELLCNHDGCLLASCHCTKHRVEATRGCLYQGTTSMHLQAVLLPKGSTDRLLMVAAFAQNGEAAAQGALLLP
jgi:hypothetical protein